jgi:PAS domain S-box-containing protein
VTVNGLLRRSTALALLIAVLSTAGLAFFLAVARADADLRLIGIDRWRLARWAMEAETLSNHNSRLTMSAMLVTDQSELDRILQARATNSEEISGLMRKIAPLLVLPEEKRLFAELVAARDDYLATYLHALDLYHSGRDREAARSIMVHTATTAFEKYRRSWHALVDYEAATMNILTRESIERNGRTKRRVGGLLVLAASIAVGTGIVALARQRKEERWREQASRLLTETNATLERRIEERTKVLADTNATLEKTNHDLATALADRERATADLRANQEKLDKLMMAVEQAAESIVMTDTEGRIEYVNPAFERQTGYSLYEVAGETPSVLRSGRQGEAFYGNMWQTIGQGKVWAGRVVNKRKDGGIIHNDLVISPVSDRGRIVNFVAVGRDVTREVGLEGQLVQAQKLEAVGRLAAGVAHEINTPTQFVSDNIHFLADSFSDLRRLIACVTSPPLDGGADPAARAPTLDALLKEIDLAFLMAEIPKALEQSIEGLERVTTIVRAMKDFSHVGSDERTAFDLNRAIDSALTVSRNEWKYIADVHTNYDPGLPPVPMVVNEMNQVFLNLIVNAAHAIAESTAAQPGRKGNITIDTRRSGDFAEIRIRDDGAGIPSEVRARIFEPFFTTKALGKGTGQGLSLSRSIVVDRHQGQIGFESEVGVGTTFIIQLPMVDRAPKSGGGRS